MKYIRLSIVFLQIVILGCTKNNSGSSSTELNKPMKGLVDSIPSNASTVIPNSKNSAKEPIRLSADLQNPDILILKTDSLQNFYVSQGSYISKFDKEGKLTEKISPNPKDTNSTSSTIIDFVIHGSVFYCISSGKLFMIQSSGNVADFPNIKCGNHLRLNNNVFYTDYQEFDKSAGKIHNSIKQFNLAGQELFSPKDYDSGNMNFEIIDDKIMFYGGDYYFYSTSIKDIRRRKLSELPENLVWFLGKEGDYYVFKTNDSETKLDKIYLYDNKFRLFDTFTINLPISEIPEKFFEYSENFMEYPSGIIYHYDGNKKIFFLRHTMKGTFIYELSSFINKR